MLIFFYKNMPPLSQIFQRYYYYSFNESTLIFGQILPYIGGNNDRCVKTNVIKRATVYYLY